MQKLCAHRLDAAQLTWQRPQSSQGPSGPRAPSPIRQGGNGRKDLEGRRARGRLFDESATFPKVSRAVASKDAFFGEVAATTKVSRVTVLKDALSDKALTAAKFSRAVEPEGDFSGEMLTAANVQGTVESEDGCTASSMPRRPQRS